MYVHVVVFLLTLTLRKYSETAEQQIILKSNQACETQRRMTIFL